MSRVRWSPLAWREKRRRREAKTGWRMRGEARRRRRRRRDGEERGHGRQTIHLWSLEGWRGVGLELAWSCCRLAWRLAGAWLAPGWRLAGTGPSLELEGPAGRSWPGWGLSGGLPGGLQVWSTGLNGWPTGLVSGLVAWQLGPALGGAGLGKLARPRSQPSRLEHGPS